jgi:hypothetical protein
VLSIVENVLAVDELISEEDALAAEAAASSADVAMPVAEAEAERAVDSEEEDDLSGHTLRKAQGVTVTELNMGRELARRRARARTTTISATSSLLLPYVPQLLEQFYLRFSAGAMPSVTAGRRPRGERVRDLVQSAAATTGKRELAILSRVSTYIAAGASVWGDGRCGETCGRLVGLLLPFLRPGARLKDTDKVQLLVVLEGLVPLAPDLSHQVVFLSKLLGPGVSDAGQLHMRQALLRLLNALASSASTAWLSAVMTPLMQMHAVSRGRLGEEYDYDTILTTYESFNETGFKYPPRPSPDIDAELRVIDLC